MADTIAETVDLLYTIDQDNLTLDQQIALGVGTGRPGPGGTAGTDQRAAARHPPGTQHLGAAGRDLRRQSLRSSGVILLGHQ